MKLWTAAEVITAVWLVPTATLAVVAALFRCWWLAVPLAGAAGFWAILRHLFRTADR